LPCAELRTLLHTCTTGGV